MDEERQQEGNLKRILMVCGIGIGGTIASFSGGYIIADSIADKRIGNTLGVMTLFIGLYATNEAVNYFCKRLSQNRISRNARR